MKITVNLATRPFADLGPTLKRLRIAMAVFVLVSIGLGVGLHALHAKAEAARAREHAVDAQIAKINQERQGYQAMMRLPDNAQVLQQANTLNALFDQKAFSWTLAMEDLETVLPGGVQVTTLEPVRDEKTGEITLKLRVVGPRDKGIELVQNLEHSRHFLHPAITGESIESSGGPNAALEPVSASNRVNFELNAQYNPATLAELPAHAKTEEKKPTAENSSETEAAAPVQTHAVPAVGPGLRRPPMRGISKPPAAAQAAGTPRSPYVARPTGTVPVPQSPQAMRPAGQTRSQIPQPVQTVPGSQQTPRRQPGGPQ